MARNNMGTSYKLMTYAQAMKDFFYRDGDTLQSFMAEMKALSAEDKAEFKQLLTTIGYELRVE